MLVWKVQDLRAQYRELCEDVLMIGDAVEPRGIPTHEITNVALVFHDGPHAATFPTAIGRKVSPAILAAELMQWIAGVSDLRQLQSVSKARFGQFSDTGDQLYGAYGPRAYRGLERVVRILQSDPDSRKATVSIWRGHETIDTKDLPCTINWSFILRDGHLNMTTFMRSNDVFTGVAYDVPAMARIQSAVAWALEVLPGEYTHVVQSLHIYDKDISAVKKLEGNVTGDVPQPPLLYPMDGLSKMVPVDRWVMLRDEWARVAVRPELQTRQLPAEFEWYAKQLVDHPGYPEFCERCRYYLPQMGLEGTCVEA